MAKIETTFIRPKEEFNVDTGKAKVVYDGYQNNPHEIELKENLDGDVEGVINDTFKENDNNNVAFTDSEGNEHELITSEGFGDALNEALPAALANAQVITTTWAELKDLRDNKQLIAGSLYRITDYNCTTTQENTRSAGHQFDIVILALSADKLAEEGWAMMNESDVYDVTFADGVTKKCWVYVYASESESYHYYNIVDYTSLLGNDAADSDMLTINEDNKTAIVRLINSTELDNPDLTYNYFQNSKLEAWKVWYCLDNDTARFAWADDSVDEGSPASIMKNTSADIIYTRNLQNDTEYENVQYYAWEDTNNNVIYTTSETPQIGDSVYGEGKGGSIEDLGMTVSQFTPAHQGTGLPNGRGVVYRLIDEFNNDVAYDFKNIQFVRKLTDGEYDADTGTNTWVYTFTGWDSDNSASYDCSMTWNVDDGYCYDNKISAVADENNDLKIVLPDNVFLSYSNSNSSIDCSRNCTMSVGGVKLISCSEIVVNTSIIFLYCSNETFGLDDPAIYINNKKVLTET